MSTFVSALPFVLATAVGAFTQDCHDICAPETIFMPEVLTPIVSFKQYQPYLKSSRVQKSHYSSIFEEGGWQ